MTNKQLRTPARIRTGDIFAAMDLLRRMMSELHSLRAATASPLLAMAIDAHEVREQLHELFDTLRGLTGESEQRHAEELSRKALGLIKRLAGDLEYLACQADGEHSEVPRGCGTCGTAN